MRRAILGPALTALGPDQLGHLELHQLRRDGLHSLTDHKGRDRAPFVGVAAPAYPLLRANPPGPRFNAPKHAGLLRIPGSPA